MYFANVAVQMLLADAMNINVRHFDIGAFNPASTTLSV